MIRLEPFLKQCHFGKMCQKPLIKPIIALFRFWKEKNKEKKTSRKSNIFSTMHFVASLSAGLAAEPSLPCE